MLKQRGPSLNCALSIIHSLWKPVSVNHKLTSFFFIPATEGVKAKKDPSESQCGTNPR